ncbi:trafficking protein particle complex subunit 6A, putative [Perkinsus marinus ATCC 50983]|uniref:Trafficking protein particle complex subunit 6A, putative n=1 Tax=Perkinsus marinus (strain ATCC 50983 / TXsc) TaxID=423536 RepID=C5KRB6_PERM5|nr:trafficking protein particle complex subunit 6A, putative [Perkinsus marinus ATCC 50983]EER13017.1 trafficking protein particle complex subunit 6A, putative [Perkinsus marinus ATCC 50983]|eukprot:XP_002781222.1 trafficking protein particle complex subunit 6A, putative [Perkinsus marinus ATCC 50983]
MVSQASFTVLHDAMVTRYGERMLDDGVVSYSLLESMGMWIGERLGKQAVDAMYPEQKAALERDDLAVKNVCKHLWLRLYGKQADRLQTDNRGNYVIHDYAFAPIEEMVKAGVNYNDVDATPPHVINRIEQTLELPKGIIAGYLSALGHPCYVGYFDITEAPVIGGCCFKVTMATEQQPTTRDSVDSPIGNQNRP